MFFKVIGVRVVFVFPRGDRIMTKFNSKQQKNPIKERGVALCGGCGEKMLKMGGVS